MNQFYASLIVLATLLTLSPSVLRAKDSLDIDALITQWDSLQGVNADEKQRAEVAAKLLQYWDAELNRVFREGYERYPKTAKIYLQSQRDWLKYRDCVLKLAAYITTKRDHVEGSETSRYLAEWQTSDRDALCALLTRERVLDLRRIEEFRKDVQGYDYDWPPYSSLSRRKRDVHDEMEQFAVDCIPGSARMATSWLISSYEAKRKVALDILLGLANARQEGNIEASLNAISSTLEKTMESIVTLNIQCVDDEIINHNNVGTYFYTERLIIISEWVKTQLNIFLVIMQGEKYDFSIYKEEEKKGE